MASTFTTNVGLEQVAHGDDIDTWDVPVNADWAAVDIVFGNTTTLNAVAASGTVVLTQDQYRPRIIYVTGAQSNNVNYQFPSGIGGTWTVYNQTTGSKTVTFSSGGAGTSVLISKQAPSIITCDGTNVRTASSPPTSYSISSSGYYVFPGGLIQEWGLTSVIGGGGGVDVTLPLAMPNNLFSVHITPINSGTPTVASYVTGAPHSGATSSFHLNNGNSSSTQFMWFAVGN